MKRRKEERDGKTARGLLWLRRGGGRWRRGRRSNEHSWAGGGGGGGADADDDVISIRWQLRLRQHGAQHDDLGAHGAEEPRRRGRCDDRWLGRGNRGAEGRCERRWWRSQRIGVRAAAGQRCGVMAAGRGAGAGACRSKGRGQPGVAPL